MMMNLEGKTAIITGGSGTLGSAIAQGFAKAGATVGILARTEEKINQVVEEINQSGGKAFGLVGDVLDRSSLEKAREQLLKKSDTLDILVNGAGGNKAGAVITPEENFFDLSIEDMDGVYALNFKGTLLPTLVFGELMSQQKKGSIINISSMAAQQAITRVAGYSAAKAAVDNFTKWLAVEMANKHSEKIRVNAIAPGFFIAEQNHDLLLNEDDSLTSRGEVIIKNTPMKRFGEPEELQGVTNWLAGDMSSFVTGTVIPVDGGFSAFSGV